MQNQYLEVLELLPGATKADIKAAYRRLSKVYHPDVSKDEDAKAKFIEINEAYKFLTDVGPRPTTIHASAPAYDYDVQNHAYDEWRRRARAYAKNKAEEEARRQQELTKLFLRVFEMIGVVLTIVNFIIVLDLSLPPERIEGKIRGSTVFENQNQSFYETLRVEHYEFKFKKKNLNFLYLNPRYDRAVVFSTPILDQPTKVEIHVSSKIYSLKQHAGLFGFFRFIPYLIVLVWFVYKFILRSLDAQLTISVLFLFLIFFETIILLISII